MSCFSCSQIVLCTHLKVQETLGALSSKTCPYVLECVLQNLFLQQTELKDTITNSRENCNLGFRICDLDSILHSRLAKSILTVIEHIACSHSEKATGLPVSPITELFKHIGTVLDVNSSDESDDDELA